MGGTDLQIHLTNFGLPIHLTISILILICGLLIRLTACFLGWLIAAYLPALLWLTGLVICSLLGRLIIDYLPGSLLLTAGLLPLAGLVICGLLVRLIVQAYFDTLSATLTDLGLTRLIPELLRFTKQFFNRLVLCLLEKPSKAHT